MVKIAVYIDWLIYCYIEQELDFEINFSKYISIFISF